MHRILGFLLERFLYELKLLCRGQGLWRTFKMCSGKHGDSLSGRVTDRIVRRLAYFFVKDFGHRLKKLDTLRLP